MTKVNFYDSIDDSMLKFAVIIAKHNGKWVFCKHRERSSLFRLPVRPQPEPVSCKKNRLP